MNRSGLVGAESPAALALLQLVEHISEEYWAAAWLTDLERQLWRLAQGDVDAVAPPWPSSREDGIVLRRLSELCEGWWAWDETTHDVRFVPLEEWRRAHE